ncbi:MAG: cytochrome C [Pseudomonadota bacterium]|nr:cytochrome C [Pseudomonadota bacterium]
MKIASVIACGVLALGAAGGASADEFSKEDLARWQEQFDGVVKEGRTLWTDAKLGTNGVVCAQCHPNAANTHPETYPKFQKQLGKVASLWEMVNWCLRNPLEGNELAANDPKMTAMLSYIAWERRGVQLAPGKH